MLYIHGGTLPEPLVCVCVCVREGCGCGAGTLCTTLHSVRASNVACAGPNVRPERLVQPQCALNLQRCTLLALAHSGCAHPVVSTSHTTCPPTMSHQQQCHPAQLTMSSEQSVQHRLLRQNSWLWCGAVGWHHGGGFSAQHCENARFICSTVAVTWAYGQLVGGLQPQA